MPLLAQAVLIAMGLLKKIIRAIAKKIHPSGDDKEIFGQSMRATGDQPSLARRYGVAPAEVERLTGLPAAELMLKFESLGDNCEFGLVQRGCGAEPLGLLRFSCLELSHLMLALDSGFAELGAAQNMEVILSDHPKREYIVRDRKYELIFHTFQYEADGTDDNVIARHGARFAFLLRKLREDLTAGDKILVLKRNLALNDEEIGAMHQLLQRYGRNTLLVVLPGGQGQVPGTVEEVQPGLLKGYIDQFAPYDRANDMSFEIWLSICVHAYLLNLRRRDTTP